MTGNGYKEELSALLAQIEAFGTSLDTYRLDVGRYPSTEEGMAALMTAPPTAGVKLKGPYLKKAFRRISGATATPKAVAK